MQKLIVLPVSVLVLLVSIQTLPVYAFGGMGGGMSMKEGKTGFGKQRGANNKAQNTQDEMTFGVSAEMASAFVPRKGKPNVMEKYGFLLTGLVPVYPETHECPKVGSEFADPYRTDGSRRSKKFFAGRHGGMDIPQPQGVPLIAMADGEILLRHEGNEGGIGGKGI